MMTPDFLERWRDVPSVDLAALRRDFDEVVDPFLDIDPEARLLAD